MDYLIIKCPHCKSDVGDPCVYSSSMGQFANPDTTSAEIREKMEREGLPLPHGRVHQQRKSRVDKIHDQRRVSTVGELREALADLNPKLPVWVQVSRSGYGGQRTMDPVVFVDTSWGGEVLISGDPDSLEGR